MNNIYICFSIKAASYSLDEDFQTVYKPLLKFLYNNPQFDFTFSFSGPQLLYFKKRKKEVIQIIKEMMERNQVEVLGGGYYSPVLPLLFSVDRNGQIDMLSSELRQTFGKRPRGVTLFADCWDSSLVNNLQTCGIEYTLLDSSIISNDKLKFLPLIISELGKSVEIYPSYESFTPLSTETPYAFLDRLCRSVEKVEKKDKYLQKQPDRIVTINLSHSQVKELNSVKWFEKLYLTLNESQDCKIKLTTISQYKKSHNLKVTAHISSGMNHKIAEGAELSIFGRKGKEAKVQNAYDFMQIYRPSHSLYNRMLYVSMMINQCKIDKMRKKAAREKLWEAQNGVGLLCTTNSIFSNEEYRQRAFINLMEAEKILREDGSFKEAVTCFDYDGDGFDEYICRMQNYFSYISLVSGAIHALQPVKVSGNYADNHSRVEEWDGQEDDYTRGLFVDFLFSKEQHDDYINGQIAPDGVFSKIHYEQLKFISSRHELQLTANAIFNPTKQEVLLKKKYIINSDGMNVQYIIKNLSNKPLKAKFVVESNFNNVNFNQNHISYFNVEVLNKDERVVIDSENSTQKLNKKNKLCHVDFARIADLENGVTFSFEPNELCSYYYCPITFKRPSSINNKKENIGMTFVSSLMWDIDIESGKETEKNINFTISSVKKRSVTK